MSATAGWVGVTGLGQIWRFGISVASTVILARLLVPADFGLLATVAPIIGFVDLLRDAGFSQALVQREEVTLEQSHGLFWMTMALTALLGLLLVLASPSISAFFHEPRLKAILWVSALSMQLSSFSSQPWAFLNRHLRFNTIAVIDAIQGTVGLLVSAVCAMLTHSYWAIVVGGLSTTVSGSILAVWFSRWTPGRPRFDADVIQMARFGAGVSFSNVFNFLSRNSDNLLIARADGPVPLGLYDRGYKLMLLPLTQMTWPVSRVLVPVLSRLQRSPEEYRSLYMMTITVMMTAAQPGLIAATVLATPLIATLLGDRWSGVAPIFVWLGAAGVEQVVTSSAGWLYLSQGRARDYATSGLVGSASTIGSFLIGLPWGPVGVAAAYAISDYLVRLPFAWWFVGRRGPVTHRDLAACLTPHVVAGVLSAASLFAIRYSTQNAGNLAYLVPVIAATYIIYVAVLLVFPAKRRVAGAIYTKMKLRVLRKA